MFGLVVSLCVAAWIYAWLCVAITCVSDDGDVSSLDIAKGPARVRQNEHQPDPKKARSRSGQEKAALSLKCCGRSELVKSMSLPRRAWLPRRRSEKRIKTGMRPRVLRPPLVGSRSSLLGKLNPPLGCCPGDTVHGWSGGCFGWVSLVTWNRPKFHRGRRLLVVRVLYFGQFWIANTLFTEVGELCFLAPTLRAHNSRASFFFWRHVGHHMRPLPSPSNLGLLFSRAPKIFGTDKRSSQT